VLVSGGAIVGLLAKQLVELRVGGIVDQLFGIWDRKGI
jgi:hypothetical protein